MQDGTEFDMLGAEWNAGIENVTIIPRFAIQNRRVNILLWQKSEANGDSTIMRWRSRSLVDKIHYDACCIHAHTTIKAGESAYEAGSSLSDSWRVEAALYGCCLKIYLLFKESPFSFLQ